MSCPLKVLIIDDNSADAELMLDELRQAGFEPDAHRVDNEADFIVALDTKPEIILADFNLPSWSGLEALAKVRRSGLEIPVIVVSGSIGEETATEVMRLGAADYLMKDRLRRLGTAVARALSEQRLHHEQRIIKERYRLLFERAQDGIFSIAANRCIFALNPAFAKITGWEPIEWIGFPFDDLIVAEDHVRAAELFARALRGEPSPPAELRVRTKAGGYREVEFTAFATNSGDASSEVLGIGRDVTERKQAERMLREQNEILSNSHEGVMIVGLDDRVRFWNRAAVELLGWTAAEARDQPPEKLLGLVGSAAIASLREAVTAKGFWQGELAAQARDGRRLTIECRTTLVRDEAGQPRARLNLLADITEKKQLEEKFLHAQRLESLGMLAAGIAHDLNNVLAPVMFVAPLLRETHTEPRDIKLLNTLEMSAARGAALVRQILGFAQSTTGEFRPVPVKHIVRDVVAMIEQTFPKSIQMESHIPSDLWVINGNPTQIHQVILNLCVNARDAMPEGGALRITAENRQVDTAVEAHAPHHAGAWVMLEIADTGTGIAPELLERIWEPFFTTKPEGKGTGLGLATVRGIVASHKGEVELETAIGRGTTFRIFFPAAEMPETNTSDAAADVIAGGRGELILVVDDDVAIREIIESILGRCGFRVTVCADGAEAINVFSARPQQFSLVITDVDMPYVGGVALAAAIRHLRSDIPVVAMSGLSHQSTRGSGLLEIRQLAHGFLVKPFKADELLKLVEQLLHPVATP